MRKFLVKTEDLIPFLVIRACIPSQNPFQLGVKNLGMIGTVVRNEVGSIGGIMFQRFLILSCFLTTLSFAQIPDRDELVKLFVNEKTSVEGATQLIQHFQWGGLRTMIRNLDKLSPERCIMFAPVLRNIAPDDLMRFRNDLNANVTKVSDPKSRAMFLMLLGILSRDLDPAVFQTYVDDEMAPMVVRLAAAGGMAKVQNPALFKRYHALAETAIFDPTTGQNDFLFSGLTIADRAFYLFTRSALENASKPEQGLILSAVTVAENSSKEIYQKLMDKRKKKMIPVLIDRAIQVGGVSLLDLMLKHKTCKKFKSEVQKGKEAAQKIAPYMDKLWVRTTPATASFGAILPENGEGSGAEPGYRSTYAIVKVAANGDMSVVEHVHPFGGSDNFEKLFSGKTLPAYTNWKPIDSYYLVVAP